MRTSFRSGEAPANRFKPIGPKWPAKCKKRPAPAQSRPRKQAISSAGGLLLRRPLLLRTVVDDLAATRATLPLRIQLGATLRTAKRLQLLDESTMRAGSHAMALFRGSWVSNVSIDKGPGEQSAP